MRFRFLHTLVLVGIFIFFNVNTIAQNKEDEKKSNH